MRVGSKTNTRPKNVFDSSSLTEQRIDDLSSYLYKNIYIHIFNITLEEDKAFYLSEPTEPCTNKKEGKALIYMIQTLNQVSRDL